MLIINKKQNPSSKHKAIKKIITSLPQWLLFQKSLDIFGI